MPTNRRRLAFASATLLAVGATTLVAGCDEKPSTPTAAAPSRVERGRYLVRAMGCADCHTPWHVGPNGPEPDHAKGLMGHPESFSVASAPALEAPWIASVVPTNTAWGGPWGVSFTANLTPDAETGIGTWTEENFVQAIRTGRHMGRGRPILPPMPWFAFRNLNDEDLTSMFAYLKSQPPVKNHVPAPIPPAAK